MPTPTGSPQTHYRTCSLCEALCGLTIETAAGRVTSIRGDKDDVFSKGHICPKATALQDLQEDPNRLKTPVRRTATGWEPIGWNEAFDEVASRLRDVQMKHGKDAVGIYLGNPTVHNYGSILFGLNFIRALATKNRYSATSVDQLPHQFVAYFMFGHQLLIPIPDVDRTRHLLILGANPAASNGSLMSAPGIADRIKAIRERGGKVVLIDPRRTESAALADEHHFVRPGTDALLLMAMLNTIFAENLAALDRLAAMTKGLDELRAAVSGVTPDMAAPVTGISAAEIRRIAREFAAAPAAVCYGRFGVSTQKFGALCHWLINALNIVTGNVDRVGGGMFTFPAVDGVGLTMNGVGGLRGSYARRKSRVRGFPEFGGEFPVAVMAEEMLTPGKGQMRAFVTSAGNPVLSTPNGTQLEKALPGIEFMVSIDFYINETTRHAHIILPPTAPLEHDNYDLAFHFLTIRNTSKYSPQVFPIAGDQRHDWQIFLELQRRLEGDGMAANAKAAVLRRLGPAGIVDLGLRTGPYGDKFMPLSKGLSLKKLKENPHGIDLGALTPMLPERLATKDNKIDLAPQILLGDIPRLKDALLGTQKSPAGFDLLLIGRRHIRSNNSWLHNSLRLVKGPDRCTLLVHPDDAGSRGLSAGTKVRVVSRVGTLEAPIEISDSVMPGVVSLPHGWGHNRPGAKLDVAAAHAGVSLNDVTDDLLIDALAGTSVLNGVPVRVEAVS